MLSSKTRITVLALTGALAITGVADASPKAKLTIKGPNGDFQGTIKAKKRSCMNGRTVHVYMVTDDGPQEIGSDTSELNSDKTRGVWSIGNSGYRNGRFFARADSKGSCRQLRSKTITVVTPDAEEEQEQQPSVIALQVDGADGGYSRQHCERLLQDWSDEVDKANEDLAQGNGEGPEAASAMDRLKHADETYADMSDNCLVVY